jgi:hypothetical protein
MKQERPANLDFDIKAFTMSDVQSNQPRKKKSFIGGIKGLFRKVDEPSSPGLPSNASSEAESPAQLSAKRKISNVSDEVVESPEYEQDDIEDGFCSLIKDYENGPRADDLRDSQKVLNYQSPEPLNDQYRGEKQDAMSGKSIQSESAHATNRKTGIMGIFNFGSDKKKQEA